LRPPVYYGFCAFLRHTSIIAGGFLIFKVHFHGLQECLSNQSCFNAKNMINTKKCIYYHIKSKNMLEK
ncbi:MAG: hypothetical protein ACTSPQ_21410, partial [Candidatus Helarchaeota archaeon]